MSTAGLKIGIVGDIGIAWEDFGRLLAIDGVTCAGCVDADPNVARMLVERFPVSSEPIAVFEDVPSLIRQGTPDALIIAAPDRSHYRAAMDGLQAGCHLLLMTPLSANVQEIVDIAGLARARECKVCLSHQFRHIPSLVRARQMLSEGAIGRPRLVTSTATHAGPPLEGGWLAQVGLDWIDAVLRTVPGTVEMVAATQAPETSGLGPVTLASLRFAGGPLVSLAMSEGSDRPTFELVVLGETGRLIASDTSLRWVDGQGIGRDEPLSPREPDFATNFVGVIREGATPLCQASEAVDAVRVLEAIIRSAAIGQFVSLA